MNKFVRKMCLALSLVLCVSLAATSVSAAEPTADKGNSRMVTVTYKILVENEAGDDLDEVILGTEQIEVEYGTEFIHEEELSNIPKGYKINSIGIRIRDSQTEVSTYLVLDPDAPTKPTEPEVTEPSESKSRMVTVTYMRMIEEDGELIDEIMGTEEVEVEYGVEYITTDMLSNIPKGYMLMNPFGVSIDDSRNEAWAYVVTDPTNPPETEPEETVPETKPDETVPETKPDETVPETKPEETVPETKPNETVPETKPSETTPATKPDADNSGKDDVPKTGDESHLMLWTAVASVSLIGVGAVVFTMKKKATR